ncbi:MAG: hypothetical protein LBH25_06165 [Fibromonadaceae bacterium]|nr:hypothetical protein [Fibromonadaceae bacterium]
MNKQTTRKGVACYAPAIAAGLMLAMAFTLNACGGDGGGGGDDAPSSSSSGNGSPSSSSSGGGSPSSKHQPQQAWRQEPALAMLLLPKPACCIQNATALNTTLLMESSAIVGITNSTNTLT